MELYESRPDICNWNIGQGRSINFTLCHRGRAALSAIGCEEGIVPMCVPVYGRMIHSLNGTTSSQLYSTKGEFMYVNLLQFKQMYMSLLEMKRCLDISSHASLQ